MWKAFLHKPNGFGKLVVVTLLSMVLGCAVPKPVQVGHRIPVLTPEQLAARIDAILADSLLTPTNVGIEIVSLKTGRVLYQRNAYKLFHPASNMKMLTTAAALHYLGPDFTLNTVLATDSAATIRDSVLSGDLYLKGYGNPQLDIEDLDRMARELKAAGINRITGNLLCDASYFDSVRWPSGWMWDDQNSLDFVSVRALAVHNNIVEVTVWPGGSAGDTLRYSVFPPTAMLTVTNTGVTVSDSVQEEVVAEREWQWPRNHVVIRGQMKAGDAPETFEVDVLHPHLFVGDLLRQALHRAGIQLEGTVQEGILPDNARILVVHRSEPLSVVALHTNKPSNNLSAEMLCKTVGAEVYGVPGTWDKGLSAIRAYLDSLGIDSTTYEIVDGSGVSRYNLVYPHMLVTLLRGISSDFGIEPEFTASLPIAGVDGSLQHRMKGTPAEGVLRAKTGTLSGVSALSGYTETADGERLAFSILMQHFVVPARNMRAIQDKIGALISGVRLRY